MIELDDCGREIHLTFGGRISSHSDVNISMIIKAPRGTLILFGADKTKTDDKCGVIRLFMEEHKDE